ncbi:hypothetical protein HYT17_01405 [Candidatus Microgenomates bacterium]|nr:hypothetical protein [Candidatus Microgenomates bacterium]
MIYYLLFLLLAVSFIVRVLLNTLNFIWLWQIKEYRLDRLFVHLKETNEGRRLMVNRSSVLFWLLVAAVPLAYVNFTRPVFLVLATLVFLLNTKEILRQILKRTFRRPQFTLRATLISVLTFMTVFWLLIILPLPIPVSIVVIDRLIFITISLFVLATFLPVFFTKIFLVESAKRRIESMKNLTVIGVTGSYGKSLTKELIASFLAEKFTVLKTPRSVNTDLAIAKLILGSIAKEHQIFVVEMGAYKRGEIAKICDMVKPKIGVLTGINEQHLSLFGSLENTKEAKFELLAALPKDGLAIINGDDANVLSLVKKITVKTHVYKSTDIKVRIVPFGANLAAAAAVSKNLGVSKEKIKSSIKKSLPFLGLKILQKGNMTILDDSFNANPAGFNAALLVLKTYPGLKILVTAGIIELGGKSYDLHKQLGQKIGTICDVVILTSNNFAKPVSEGLMTTKFDMKNFLVPKREELLLAVKRCIKGKTVILLEGRIPLELKFLI